MSIKASEWGIEMAVKRKPQVKCPGCSLTFYREDESHVHIKNRYWHEQCYKVTQDKVSKSESAVVNLENYICTLFGAEYVSPRIKNQIKTMMANYGYSYSGILGSLEYFFEIKGNSIDKANNGIGIVPYIYDDAKKYYETIFYAHQQNKGINSIEIETKDINITSPRRKIKKKKVVDLEFLERGNAET